MERKEFFNHFDAPELPSGLFDKIMARIREEERLMSARKRLFFFLTTVLMSAGTLIPVMSALQTEFVQSGFMQFLLLFFSDAGVVVSSWQDFGLALLESLPAVNASALLFTLLVLLWSLKHFVHTARAVFHQPQLIRG